MKDLLKSQPPSDLELVFQYPADPKDLPKEIYDRVYQEEPPVPKYIFRYEALGHHVPLRKSSKLLRDAASDLQVVPWKQAPSSSWWRNSSYSNESEWSWDDSCYDTRPTRKQLAIEDRRYAFEDRSPLASPSESPLQCLAPRIRTQHVITSGAVDEKSKEKEEPEPSSEENHEEGGPIRSPKKRPMSEDIEEAAFQRLLKRQDHKKEARKEKKCQAAAKKRPASASVKTEASASVKTEPPSKKYGKVIPIVLHITWEKKRDAKRTRNAYTSSWYKKAEKILNNKGTIIPDKKATLSSILKKAGGVWDNHKA